MADGSPCYGAALTMKVSIRPSAGGSHLLANGKDLLTDSPPDEELKAMMESGPHFTCPSSISSRSLFRTNFADSVLAAFLASSRLTGLPTRMTPAIPIILCAAHS